MTAIRRIISHWLVKQNAYALIKKLVLIILVYDLISAIFFALGSFLSLGGFLSGTTILYLTITVISYTPKGLIYYSGYFRFTVVLLLVQNIFNMSMRYFDVDVRQRYAVVVAILFTAFISFMIGLFASYRKHKRNEKTDSSAQS